MRGVDPKIVRTQFIYSTEHGTIVYSIRGAFSFLLASHDRRTGIVFLFLYICSVSLSSSFRVVGCSHLAVIVVVADLLLLLLLLLWFERVPALHAIEQDQVNTFLSGAASECERNKRGALKTQ